MEGFQIRRAIPDKDYEQLAVLLSQIWSDPVSSDGLREWDTTEDGRSMNRRMVLVDAAEKVVGYSSVFREGSAENGRYAPQQNLSLNRSECTLLAHMIASPFHDASFVHKTVVVDPQP